MGYAGLQCNMRHIFQCGVVVSEIDPKSGSQCRHLRINPLILAKIRTKNCRYKIDAHQGLLLLPCFLSFAIVEGFLGSFFTLGKEKPKYMEANLKLTTKKIVLYKTKSSD